ncbi:MAG: hypothetical protein HQL82_16335 [Magnetococcales bacterium]|nr:hypothetical protein [Magnetococcales bacterium]
MKLWSEYAVRIDPDLPPDWRSARAERHIGADRTPDPGPSGSGRIWPPWPDRVTLSRAGAQACQWAARLTAQVVAGIRHTQWWLLGLYGRDGRARLVSEGIPRSPLVNPGAARWPPATAAIWPAEACRVSLSPAARLVAGVLGHMDATPEQQGHFLREVAAACQEGRLEATTLERARHTVGDFLAVAEEGS